MHGVIEREASFAAAAANHWSTVRDCLRAELGEDSFSSWFGRVEIADVDGDLVRLSVPTRFLKRWIEAHYADRVLARWRHEDPSVRRIELEVRSVERRFLFSRDPELGRAEPATTECQPDAGSDLPERDPIRLPKWPWMDLRMDLAVRPGPLGIKDIQRAVARHYRLTMQQLLSERRTANVVWPRQVAMHLCKLFTRCSYPQIGRRFGNRDHTTVLHAVRKLEQLVEEDERIAAEIDDLKFELGLNEET